MSDEQDKESRTEEPTERKLQKAHEQGDAPVSREAATFAGFAAILVFVLAFAGGATARLATALGELTASAGATRIAAVGDAQELLLHVVVQAALAAGPALGLVAYCTAGSPGSARISTKVTTSTPNSTGSVLQTRVRMARRIGLRIRVFPLAAGTPRG